MAQTVPLSENASVTLDGSGNGTASIGPNAAGVTWSPASVSISMTGAIPTNTATCNIYCGPNVNAQTFVDGTYRVNFAASSMISGQILYVGSRIFAAWSGGNPGATATVSVNGTKTIPG